MQKIHKIFDSARRVQCNVSPVISFTRERVFYDTAFEGKPHWKPAHRLSRCFGVKSNQTMLGLFVVETPSEDYNDDSLFRMLFFSRKSSILGKIREPFLEYRFCTSMRDFSAGTLARASCCLPYAKEYEPEYFWMSKTSCLAIVGNTAIWCSLVSSHVRLIPMSQLFGHPLHCINACKAVNLVTDDFFVSPYECENQKGFIINTLFTSPNDTVEVRPLKLDLGDSWGHGPQGHCSSLAYGEYLAIFHLRPSKLCYYNTSTRSLEWENEYPLPFYGVVFGEIVGQSLTSIFVLLTCDDRKGVPGDRVIYVHSRHTGDRLTELRSQGVPNLSPGLLYHLLPVFNPAGRFSLVVVFRQKVGKRAVLDHSFAVYDEENVRFAIFPSKTQPQPTGRGGSYCILYDFYLVLMQPDHISAIYLLSDGYWIQPSRTSTRADDAIPLLGCWRRQDAIDHPGPLVFGQAKGRTKFRIPPSNFPVTQQDWTSQYLFAFSHSALTGHTRTVGVVDLEHC